jgi:hypothetical protein
MSIDYVYHSQAHQDFFALSLNQFKTHGTYVEIGSNDPVVHNNTCTMETQRQWAGLMVEYDQNFLSAYRQQRPKSIHIISDARDVDYLGLLRQHHFPTTIDYLQIDLDVNNRSTLTTLEKLDQTVLDQYRFSTVTFEHDIYTGDFHNTRKISRDLFQRRGYLRLFNDVSTWWIGKWCQFEDWYVYPTIFNTEMIDKILADPDNKSGISSEQCATIIKKYLLK